MRFTFRTGAARKKQRLRRVPSVPTRRATVTAVVPTYNYARFLRACVNSALNQRDVAVTVVIVDDCSTDETPSVAAELASRDPRVTVIRNTRNEGMIPTVNRGLSLAEGEYVAKLDADDVLPPGALARATALLEACPDVGFVYGRPHHFSGDVPHLVDTRSKSWTIWPGAEWLMARCRSSANVISQPEVVMRTALVREAGSFRVELAHTSDMHMWLSLASIANVGRINGAIQGLYRVHDGSMQRTIHSGMMVDIRGRRDAFAALLQDEAERSEQARELLTTAHKALAAGALDLACRAYDRGKTAQQPVDELVALALDVCPEAKQLKEWRKLDHRRAVGAHRAQLHPQFFARALTRRLLEELGHRNWLRTGEL
jgi:hypothetical protein